MIEQAFNEKATQLKRWTHLALESWAMAARDPRGGFCEQRHPDGRADFDHIRRVRVQARLTYVYAHAAHLNWYDGAKAASDHAWNFVVTAGMQGGDDGCAHLVYGDGRLKDGLRDLYAQAFILLAGAWRYRAFGDQAALGMAEETLSFINRTLKADNGGWLESWPLREGPRRQNPHMHLFEAFIALYDATQNSAYLDYAEHIYALFEAHFWDAEQKDLLEFFNDDWSPAGDGGPIEPGHMMEWCWLLREYQRVSGMDMRHYCDTLFGAGLKRGLDKKSGLICDVVSLDGDDARPTFRSWPQTELLKAAVAQVHGGQMDTLDWATKTIDNLLSRYLRVDVPGGWVDKLDATYQPVNYVMPSSTFYHYFCAAAEVDALRQELVGKAF